MKFTSTILIMPGLGNSGELHWQSIWQSKYPYFERIEQSNWETPMAKDWVETLEVYLKSKSHNNIILVAHSLACTTIALWAERFPDSIKAALLVAPSDTEALSYLFETTGFTPIPQNKLPFKSIVVASTDDPYVSLERAVHLAEVWGSEFVNIGPVGHINASSNLGDWEFGLSLLKQLDV